MKLKDISAILRAGRKIYIFEGGDCQWLGDGCCAYPIYGLPRMEEFNLSVLLDISDKHWEKYSVQSAELPLNVSDNDIDEFQLADIGISMSYRETVAIPLIGNHSLFYIQPKYLRPFRDGGSYSYYARKTKNGRYVIAVKEGFILRGIISPYDFVTEEYVDKLNTVLRLSHDILSQKREEKQKNIEFRNFMNMTFAENGE